MSEEKKNEMVELNDDQVDQVAGGGPGDDGDYTFCPKCFKGDKVYRTGNTRPGSFLGIFDDYEYQCGHCKFTWWSLGIG